MIPADSRRAERHRMAGPSRRLSGLLSLLVLCGALLGCTHDTTITRGADSDSHWRRRIAAAIPAGTALETARSTMQGSGFQCEPTPTGAEALACEKVSKTHLGGVRRRWQAWFTAVDGRVTAVRSSTELLGP
jgi:hypothetical protein